MIHSCNHILNFAPKMYSTATSEAERASGSLRVLKMREEARVFDRELSSFQASVSWLLGRQCLPVPPAASL
jgi:hypothetical protein